MDERVYDVQVCSSCFTQVRQDRDCDWAPCLNCESLESKPIRFRVARSAVLKQVDPHQSLIERTVYFGCVGESGHYYWSRSRDGRPVKFHLAGRSLTDEMKSASPWGTSIDGGLFGRNSSGPPEGEAHIFHKDGWTAVAFQDRSVDSRPGSWSVFCIPDTLDGPNALIIARAAFPTIFARYTFDVTLA